MKKHLILICLALLCLVPKLMAQKTWTLKECIAYGRKRSFKAEETSILNAAYIEDKKSIEAAYLPQFNGVVIPSYTNNPYNYFWQYGAGFEANAIIYSGSRKKEELEKANLIVLQSQYTIASAQNDIELQVLYAYTEALIKKEQFLEGIKFYQDAIKLRSKLSDTKTHITEYKTFFETLLQQDWQEIHALSLQYQQALLKIRQLINLEYTPDFDIEEIPSFIPDYTTVKEAFPKAIMADPAISSNELDVAVASKNIAIAKSFLDPTISIQGSCFYNQNNNNTSGFQNYLSLRITIPVWNIKGQNANIERSLIHFKYQNTRLENQKKTLHNTIVLIINELQNKEIMYENMVRTLEQSSLLLNETTKNLETSKTTYELYLIIRNWNKQNALQAVVLKYETITQAKLLDFYTGTAL